MGTNEGEEERVLAKTSPTSGDLPVDIVRSRTQREEFFFLQ
jgi:hypothetical protein